MMKDVEIMLKDVEIWIMKDVDIMLKYVEIWMMKDVEIPLKEVEIEWWKMLKYAKIMLKEHSHLRWNSWKTWSISLPEFHLSTYFNIYTGLKTLKDEYCFNVFQHYFNSIISMSLKRQIWVSTYLNIFISTLFQHYFNIISTYTPD